MTDRDGKFVVAAQVRVRPDPETPFDHTRAYRIRTDQNGVSHFRQQPANTRFSSLGCLLRLTRGHASQENFQSFRSGGMRKDRIPQHGIRQVS